MPKVSNVYQDKKSKKWYFVANLGYDHEGKRIRHWERGFATQKDAKIAYSKYMNDFSDSAVKMNSTMSYKEFLYSYFLPDMEKDVCDSTYRARLSYIKVHFCYFFNVKLKDITAPMIKKWQNSLSEKYSSAYVNKIYTTFRISLDLAVQLNLLKENVARKVKNVKEVNKEVDFWTLDEFKKVISCIDTSKYLGKFRFSIIWTLFMTGIRRGEIQALTWDDIDFDNKTLIVNKSMVYYNKDDFYVKKPKTKAGIRILALDDKTINVLLDWKKSQSQNVKTNYVFSFSGLPFSKELISEWLGKYSKLANVHRIKAHALRHSHVALLMSMGENILVIKDRLGHKDIKTTLGIYGHLYPNVNKEIANKLNLLALESLN